MRVPLLDLKRQYQEIGAELEATACRVLASGNYILGDEVSAFEKEAAAKLGAKHGLGVSSGTDALICALMALDIGPGDEVICPSYTFFATAGCIARLGARPVFVDCEPQTLNLSAQLVEAALSPKTKAVIAVHLFGRAADTEAIRSVLDPKGIPLVEDAAQAIGSELRGKPCGSLGKVACFSFFPSKNLGACGDGGLVTTNDSELHARMLRLRNHGMAAQYEHHEVGGNFRLDALQAALLRKKLQYLDQWNEARRANARRWVQLFADKGLAEFVRCPEDDPQKHSYHQYVVRVRAEQRDGALTALQEAGVGSAVYYRLPLHRQPCFQPNSAHCPEADVASRESIALPIFPELRAEEQEYSVDVLAKALLP
ncbi:MAG: transcriptional regulator [Planctomycetota bacterium]|nr:MAG: transcriptional regulator [Planctomycetota bacterium]